MQEYIQQPKKQHVDTRIQWIQWSYNRKTEQPDPEEAEENNLKYNFMKMIETLKEEMKNSLKEREEKTNKNWKKSLKEIQSNRWNKHLEQFKTVWKLK